MRGMQYSEPQKGEVHPEAKEVKEVFGRFLDAEGASYGLVGIFERHAAPFSCKVQSR